MVPTSKEPTINPWSSKVKVSYILVTYCKCYIYGGNLLTFFFLSCALMKYIAGDLSENRSQALPSLWTVQLFPGPIMQ